MILTDPFPPVLPASLSSDLATRLPIDADVDVIARLEDAARKSVDPAAKPMSRDELRSRLVGTRSWSRRQVVVVPRSADGSIAPDAAPVGWIAVEDRAAGRTNVSWGVAPEVPYRDELVLAIGDWAQQVAGSFARHRGVESTILNDGADTRDTDRLRLLEMLGYERKRTWLHMERPVHASDATSLPGPRDGVRVRPVRRHESGLPIAQDVRWIHIVLQESFEDHFNSYRESFSEFVGRLGEGQKADWDHWWIAEIEVSDGSWQPAGGLVAEASAATEHSPAKTYLEYLGVHRTARGRGVAKALLNASVKDAAENGRAFVGLEVDADSPTGANKLYESMGWVEKTRSETWQLEVPMRASNLENALD